MLVLKYSSVNVQTKLHNSKNIVLLALITYINSMILNIILYNINKIMFKSCLINLCRASYTIIQFGVIVYIYIYIYIYTITPNWIIV